MVIRVLTGHWLVGTHASRFGAPRNDFCRSCRDDPADIVSRGSTVTELDVSIWFTGPPLLYEGISKWPVLKMWASIWISLTAGNGNTYFQPHLQTTISCSHSKSTAHTPFVYALLHGCFDSYTSF